MTARRYAPVPDGARGPAVDPDKGYLVEEIRDGMYWVTDGVYQAMFATTGQGVIAVDAPPSIGHHVLTAIGDVTDEPVTHVVLSHSHGDHVGAAYLFPAGATFISHAETAATLRRRNDPRRPIPSVTFTDSYSLEVGDKHLSLNYLGPNHERGNIAIHAPDQRILMIVDVFFPGWVPFKYLALSEDVPGYIDLHNQALEFEFDTLVSGHLTRLGTRDDVEVQREYVQDVRRAAADALQSVSPLEVVGDSGSDNLWVFVDAWYRRIAETAAADVEPKWVGRLGGADVWTEAHCWMMMESLRLDENLLPVAGEPVGSDR